MIILIPIIQVGPPEAVLGAQPDPHQAGRPGARLLPHPERGGPNKTNNDTNSNSSNHNNITNSNTNTNSNRNTTTTTTTNTSNTNHTHTTNNDTDTTHTTNNKDFQASVRMTMNDGTEKQLASLFAGDYLDNISQSHKASKTINYIYIYIYIRTHKQTILTTPARRLLWRPHPELGEAERGVHHCQGFMHGLLFSHDAARQPPCAEQSTATGCVFL